MTKYESLSEIADKATVTEAPSVWNRRDKLRHLAELCRRHQSYLRLEHNLEHWHYGMFVSYHVLGSHTAFELAVKDPVFQSMGLSPNANLWDTMRFFELTQNQLHEFSCDCGGALTNTQMANRIERLAG